MEMEVINMKQNNGQTVLLSIWVIEVLTHACVIIKYIICYNWRINSFVWNTVLN